MPTVRQKLGIEHGAILRLPIFTHERLFVPQMLNPITADQQNCDSQKFVHGFVFRLYSKTSQCRPQGVPESRCRVHSFWACGKRPRRRQFATYQLRCGQIPS